MATKTNRQRLISRLSHKIYLLRIDAPHLDVSKWDSVTINEFAEDYCEQWGIMDWYRNQTDEQYKRMVQEAIRQSL